MAKRKSRIDWWVLAEGIFLCLLILVAFAAYALNRACRPDVFL